MNARMPTDKLLGARKTNFLDNDRHRDLASWWTMQLSRGKPDRERPSAVENDDASSPWGLGSVDLPPPHSATFQGRWCV